MASSSSSSPQDQLLAALLEFGFEYHRIVAVISELDTDSNHEQSINRAVALLSAEDGSSSADMPDISSGVDHGGGSSSVMAASDDVDQIMSITSCTPPEAKALLAYGNAEAAVDAYLKHGSVEAAIKAYTEQTEEASLLQVAQRLEAEEEAARREAEEQSRLVAQRISREQEEEEAQRARNQRATAELLDREQSDEYIRALHRARVNDMATVQNRVAEFYNDHAKTETCWSALTDEQERAVIQRAKALSESGPYLLTARPLDKHGEHKIVLKKSRKRSEEPEEPAPTPTRPSVSAHLTPAAPVIDYNNHSTTLMIVPAAALSPPKGTAKAAPKAAKTASKNSSMTPTPETPSASPKPPAPYEEVPPAVWDTMLQLPFRVKYEVEVMLIARRLGAAWKLLELVFVGAVLDCVNEDGEAACIAVLRAMAAEGIGKPLQFQFHDARSRCLQQHPFRDVLDGSTIESKSVEVLNAQHCCPSGRTIVRRADYQASNRVLRLVGEIHGTDHLLRVTFVNDGTYGPVAHRGLPGVSTEFDTTRSQRVIAQCWRDRRLRLRNKTTVTMSCTPPPRPPSKWDAVLQALRDGIYVGGERFCWLAPSSSQMKNSGMWFVRESELNASLLRRCLCSDFSRLPTPALYLSRLGQCLSATTIASVLRAEETWDLQEVEDVFSESGECFSDGCGYASLQLLQLLHDALQLQQLGPRLVVQSQKQQFAELVDHAGSMDFPHSAVQVRVGGIKGVLSLKMGIAGRQLFTRPSMRKFEAEIRELEVCEWATWHAGYLNRNIITLLEHLGVKHEAFHKLQEEYLEELTSALSKPAAAKRLLQSLSSSSSAGGSSSADAMATRGMLDMAAGLIGGGVPLGEPIVFRILLNVRQALVRDVIERARVRVEQAATLMGIMDEDGVLDYGEVFISVRPPYAPDGAGYETIEGSIVVYRSPGMHPSDVRVLKAVWRTELGHHKNVIVFPRRGPRPHPIEMSRGDLDGDKYLIIWEPSIVSATRPSSADLTTPVALHKQEQIRPSQPSASSIVLPPARLLHMPPPPPPPPSEHAVMAQVAHSEALRAAKPGEFVRAAPLGDFLGHARHRNRKMSVAEVSAQGELIEAARAKKASEREERIEVEIMKRLGVANKQADEANVRHERAQEKLATRWYVDYGKRYNLGRISNLWLMYADKYGAAHEDTLELCKMAEHAVQFVKTGVPVRIDETRFAMKQRPDFMAAKKDAGSARSSTHYESSRVLGKLYRSAIRADHALEAVALANDVLADRLRIDGYEIFLAAAISARDAYNVELLWHFETYGVQTEAELLSGRVVQFAPEAAAYTNLRDAEESLRRSMHELWVSQRRVFTDAVNAAVGAAALSSEHVARQVAFAWFVAGYRLCDEEVAEIATSSARARQERELRSFPWVAWPELVGLLKHNDVERARRRQEQETVNRDALPDLVLDESEWA